MIFCLNFLSAVCFVETFLSHSVILSLSKDQLPVNLHAAMEQWEFSGG
jgi:hypothetical protein